MPEKLHQHHSVCVFDDRNLVLNIIFEWGGPWDTLVYEGQRSQL